MQLPDDVRRAVDSLVASARASLGEALRAVILYGSAAEGIPPSRALPTAEVGT